MKGNAHVWVLVLVLFRQNSPLLLILLLFRWPNSCTTALVASASFRHHSTSSTSWSHKTAGFGIGSFTASRMCAETVDDDKDDNAYSVEHANADDTNQCKPILTMGLLADIQYAPIDDGHSYSGTPRYYRNALQVTRHAAQHFQDAPVDLCVHLGDICDGKCAQDLQAVDDVLEALAVYQHGPMLHIYGNHCLYNMDRPTLQTKLGIPFVQEPCGDWVGYYARTLTTNNNNPQHVWRGIVLDSYDVALLQRCPKNSSKRKQAVEVLQRHNSANYENGDENSPEGLEGVQQRFVAFNGGIGEIQLQWLRDELQTARQNQQRVLILSHQPILPDSDNHVCLMWNYEQVLQILRDYKDVVGASFCGHAHEGGYLRDPESGIHFRILEAVLENPHPHHTYAMVDFYSDRLHLRGFGNCESAVYSLDHLSQEPPQSTTTAATSELESSHICAEIEE